MLVYNEFARQNKFKFLTLCPGGLIETEADAGFMQSLANEIAALGWHMVVLFAEDLIAYQYPISL
jgi:hypothetical protein